MVRPRFLRAVADRYRGPEREPQRLHECEPASEQRKQRDQSPGESERVLVTTVAVKAGKQADQGVGLAQNDLAVETSLREGRRQLESPLDAACDVAGFFHPLLEQLGCARSGERFRKLGAAMTLGPARRNDEVPAGAPTVST